ncbi:MAG: 50S ribosomal protein L4, partial [Alphaproteobacteria bacterium]|nr:50S ribosomal protein L4 [Alphaproteobacteria bacterium]
MLEAASGATRTKELAAKFRALGWGSALIVDA